MDHFAGLDVSVKGGTGLAAKVGGMDRQIWDQLTLNQRVQGSSLVRQSIKSRSSSKNEVAQRLG